MKAQILLETILASKRQVILDPEVLDINSILKELAPKITEPVLTQRRRQFTKGLVLDLVPLMDFLVAFGFYDFRAVYGTRTEQWQIWMYTADLNHLQANPITSLHHLQAYAWITAFMRYMLERKVDSI